MKKEAGASAGLIALLALLLHTQLPNSENGASVQRSGGAPAAASKNAEAGNRDEVVDGPWLATQAFFHEARSSRRPRESDSRKSRKLRIKDFRGMLANLTSADKAPSPKDLHNLLGLPDREAPEMFSVVATVADPSHTHMALFLDEQTEAIERSVQDGGWDFVEQWLPWVDHFDGSGSDINERRSQRWMQREQEELPGILVFRGKPENGESAFPNRALFVFLVPETVTGGINGPAFYAAAHLADILSSDFHQIGLLGPTYSGSFASLSRLVRATENAKPAHAFSDTVYGGTVSNRDYAQAFAQETKKEFHGGSLDSRDYLAVLCEVLAKYHMAERAAVFKEDEGGLQQGIEFEHSFCENSDIKLQTYVFPREISHLRNAYQEASTDTVKDPYPDQPGRVNFSIRDANSGEDSIPTFSETQTPLTQDTILSSITGELNRQHTHVVFISVTNPLDALFLLQALRAACPDTRVFIEGANILFAAAASRQPLDGTLFLSTYPMFFEGDDWLECKQAKGACKDSSPDPRQMFAESPMQGLYNVTHLLLANIKAWNGSARLRGYRQPGHDGQPGEPYPGMWILTLNRFGFLPVDLLSTEVSTIPANHRQTDWFEHNEDKQTALPSALDSVTAPRPWMLTVFTVSAAILLACFLVVRCNVSRQEARPVWLVFSDRDAAGFAPRLEALLCAALSLSALEWILALPWCIPLPAFFDFMSFRIAPLEFSVLLGFAAPLVTLLLTLYLLRKRLSISEIVHARPRSVAYYVTPVVLFGFATGGWFYLCDRRDTGLFFRFRALELYSGSSPSMPLALACLAIFCISVFHLKQYALVGLARPRLKIQPGVPAAGYLVKLQAAYDSVEVRINAPWTLETSALVYRVAGATAFVAFCFVILGESTNAFERQPYNWLLRVVVILILLFLATKGYDLLVLWGSVRQLLSVLQILPLQSAVQRVTEEWPKQPIWAFSKSLSREVVDRELLYAIHGRAVILKKIEDRSPRILAAAATLNASAGAGPPANGQIASSADAEEYAKQLAELVFSADIPKPRLWDVLKGREDPVTYTRLGQIEKLQAFCADRAAEIFRTDLRPAWHASLNDDARQALVAGKIRDANESVSLRQRYVEYGEDFVSIQFCRFVAYAAAHVKRMATSLSLTFVLLALLFNSYSPEGSQLIARFLGALFVVIGIVVWRVFSQMERDPILSTIAHTTPGELSGEFWIQLFTLGGLPLLGVVGHLFPSVSRFLFQWIAPSVQAMR